MWLSVNGLVILTPAGSLGRRGRGSGKKALRKEKLGTVGQFWGSLVQASVPCLPPWLERNCSPLLRFLHLFIQRALFLWAVARAVLPGVTGSLEAGQHGDENSPNRWPWVSP